jgi:hypothetical protein
VIKTEIAMIGIPTGGAAKAVRTLRFVQTFRDPENVWHRYSPSSSE